MVDFAQDQSGSSVIVEERRQQVLERVRESGFVALADLARAVNVSESTLRRDLDYWHQQGTIRRTHGGAIYVGDEATVTGLEERSTRQLEEKRHIARAAAARLRDGDTVLLDGGTTTLEVARLLVGRPLSVVTNSLPIASLLAGSRETDLVFLGGYLYPKTGVALGPLTIRSAADVHVNQMILSVHGLTEKGLFNSNLLLVETERALMQTADEVVVVVDHTKIGRPALAFLCDLAAVDTIIVDNRLSAAQRAMLDGADARLIVAGETKGDTP
jgi:DeoR/GlpR family transcriptional regulator of sugar metabolism